MAGKKQIVFIVVYHDVFVLEEGEWGETGLIQMNIDTGDATPRCQLVRRTPFAARQEIATQLQQRQDHFQKLKNGTPSQN